MSKKRGVLAVAFLVLGAQAAVAQVATGPWTSYSPSYSIQERGCGDVNGSSFTLSCSTASGDQRAERRYATYSSGSRQFEGYVRVVSLGGTRISLKQTFDESNAGPFYMIAVERGGRLYAVHGGATLGSAPVGATVRINTVHYTGSDKLVVYINGANRNTAYGSGSAYYDKLGAYRTNSGQGPASVQWTNVRFWYK
jgi:hypothetical protein